jgi:hypothetical protein
VTSLAAYVVVADWNVVFFSVFRWLAAAHGMVLLCQIWDWENGLFSQTHQSPGFCVCYLDDCVSDYGRVSAFEVGWVSEVDVFYLPVTMLTNCRLDVMGFVMRLAWISYDEIETQMGFDSFDVCLMVSDICHAMAFQSLGFRAIHDLCCALAPPLSNLSAVILMVCVCGLDSVHAVYRQGRSRVWT